MPQIGAPASRIAQEIVRNRSRHRRRQSSWSEFFIYLYEKYNDYCWGACRLRLDVFASIPEPLWPKRPWARSSAGEHYVDIVGVTGSIPVAPTIKIKELGENNPAREKPRDTPGTQQWPLPRSPTALLVQS
jgi:hypothetical protein